jgi:hypothetical protein
MTSQSHTAHKHLHCMSPNFVMTGYLQAEKRIPPSQTQHFAQYYLLYKSSTVTNANI